jgi:hypothetical protein
VRWFRRGVGSEIGILVAVLMFMSLLLGYVFDALALDSYLSRPTRIHAVGCALFRLPLHASAW